MKVVSFVFAFCTVSLFLLYLEIVNISISFGGKCEWQPVNAVVIAKGRRFVADFFAQCAAGLVLTVRLALQVSFIIMFFTI